MASGAGPPMASVAGPLVTSAAGPPMARRLLRVESQRLRLHPVTRSLSFLEGYSVQAKTWQDYVRRVESFMTFCRLSGLAVDKPVLLEKAMLEYMDDCYVRGGSVSDGTKLLAAWQALHPDYARGGHHLGRVMRALKGWQKAAPAHTRWPLPQLLLFAMAGVALHRGKSDFALALVTLFSTYLRPGELWERSAVRTCWRQRVLIGT